MVAKQFSLYEVDAGWLGYLALSLFINVLLVYNIKMGLPDDVPAEAARIRVALKSMVLPKPQPVSAKKEMQQLDVEAKQIVKPQPIPQPVAVAQNADEKIVTSKAESDIQVETEAALEAPVIDQAVLETGPSATSMVDTTELPEIHQAANIQQPTYETAVMPVQPVASTEIAGKYLINAARFFTHIAEQKHDEVKQQMLENADIYLHIGHLITVDPEGMLDE